jgi:RNA polymerase sigma-70 factor (ECF subfamily)
MFENSAMGPPASASIARKRFEQLAMPHRNAAFNLAYWMMRCRTEAEDVVQEAYLRAFRAFSTFKGDSIKPWLLAIVRNAAQSALEARRRSSNVILLSDDIKARRNGEVPEAASEAPSPEAQLIANGERQQVLAALANLPLKYRDILVLREMEGQSYTEIAEVTGVPIGTVMSRLSRGRAELRKVLTRSMARNEPDAV